jgi:hypothetical protein
MRWDALCRSVTMVLVTMLSPALASLAATPDNATYHPVVTPADFRTGIDNPYFPLVPGTTFAYVETAGELSTLVSVTRP